MGRISQSFSTRSFLFPEIELLIRRKQNAVLHSPLDSTWTTHECRKPILVVTISTELFLSSPLFLSFECRMTNRPDFDQTLLSSLQSGDEQSSDDEIKTLDSSAVDNADADIDTTLASARCSSADVQTVYRELILIRTHLSEENTRLKKKADLLNQWEQRMRQTIEHGWQAHKEKFDAELNACKEKLNAATKDLKRTNETLVMFREQNSEMKRNVSDLREANDKLVEKNKQAEKRTENLVRLNQISEQKIKELEKTIEMNQKKNVLPPSVQDCSKSLDTASPCQRISVGDPCYEHSSLTPSRKCTVSLTRSSNARSADLIVVPTTPKTPTIASTDSLNFLFNWLSDITHSSLSEWPSSSPLASDTLERYSKLLTILADQASFCLHQTQSGLTLSFLRLVYLSLITIECPTTSGQTRHLHSCSYRRLCEQILRCDKNQVNSSEGFIAFDGFFILVQGTFAPVR